MKHRSTILGLLVVLLLAAGVYIVRTGSSAPAGGGPGAGEDLPDATVAEAVVEAGDLRIRIVVQPSPPVAFARMVVRVRAERGGLAVPIDRGQLDFVMAMPMGDHSYTIVPVAEGWYESMVTLPECVTGDRRWYGTIAGTIAGETRRGRFRFDLAPLE